MSERILDWFISALFCLYLTWATIHHLRHGEDVWAAFTAFGAGVALLNLNNAKDGP